MGQEWIAGILLSWLHLLLEEPALLEDCLYRCNLLLRLAMNSYLLRLIPTLQGFSNLKYFVH
jgi:hypothetical protein